MRIWLRICSYPIPSCVRHLDQITVMGIYLCEVFTRSRVDRRIGRVKKWTSRSRLTGALTKEFARHMLGVCPSQLSHLKAQNSGAHISSIQLTLGTRIRWTARCQLIKRRSARQGASMAMTLPIRSRSRIILTCHSRSSCCIVARSHFLRQRKAFLCRRKKERKKGCYWLP